MKKKISLLLVVLMLVTFMPMSMAVSEERSMESSQKFTVNGEARDIRAYIIKGKNYLKLRDAAAALKGTKAQFQVDYDKEKNLVMIETNKPYEDLSNTKIYSSQKKLWATMKDMDILFNGKERKLKSAFIIDTNYIELRDLAKLLGFSVGYDAPTKIVAITSDKVKMPCLLDFELEDFDGKKYNIADILAEHEYTLVNVWSTEYAQCKKELPDLTKLANDYNGKAGFLGVIHNIEPLTSTSSDYDKKTREENITTAKDLLNQAYAKYANLCPSQAAEKYFNFKIKAFPTVFIFDSEGNILETFIGVGAHGFYEKYERALKKYIK
ncbi:redoxin domain-containing protein [Fenollaria massiliensis]|uniref:TlpA family protein disulfide reductase n=1 Tax=Fenollaria massiliensis TaxID=938288 RepID=A0A9E7DJ33_9FIRM|nr:redoxin domain-containing protein [Fenollaria massiliensis]UQK58949.1 TlpA family protein disulfide reductase [Fenollaria massiliensis]